ncbi:MAG TPA: hypothetical protein VGQ42_12140 [Candidatus Dormibacteraeota bacterium]|jgi:hypothetical protein|nr:hypothetical protein [Candidatus Dormibacteraeota bacterium]
MAGRKTIDHISSAEGPPETPHGRQRKRWRSLAVLAAAVAALAGQSISTSAFQLWKTSCAPDPSHINLPPESLCAGGYGFSPAQPGYAISVSSSLLKVSAGGNSSTTLTVVPQNGFQGQVAMAVTLLPGSPATTAPPTATFSNGQPVNESSYPYSGQVLTFTTLPTTPLGAYEYRVQAAGPQASQPLINGNIWVRVVGTNTAAANDGGNCADVGCNFTSGGTVLPNPQIYLIFWGSLYNAPNIDALPASLMATARDLPGSQYASRLSQYGVSGLSYGATYVDVNNDGALNNPLTSGDLVAEINRVNGATGWGNGSGNRIYVIVPESGYVIAGTVATGANACAFHGWNSNLSYGYIALPNFDNANYIGSCVTDRTASVQNSDEASMTHEIVETATDPQIGTGWTDGGDEIGDVCNWYSTLLSGVRFATAQEFYDKGAGQCMGQQESGYWITSKAGCVSSSGSAAPHGDTCSLTLSAPISGVAAHPSNQGYWLVGQDGGVFAFGSAPFLKSLPSQNVRPVAPIVGIASTPDGGGYWLVGADGGVFTFGNAPFLGSMGGQHLNARVTGMAATPDGQGYWLIAADGGVFSFGDALYFQNDIGSTNGCRNISVSSWIGINASPEGLGYWNISNIGDMSPHSDTNAKGNPAPFFGSAVCESNTAMVGSAANFDRWGALMLDANAITYPVGNVTGPASGVVGAGNYVGLAFSR